MSASLGNATGPPPPAPVPRLHLRRPHQPTAVRLQNRQRRISSITAGASKTVRLQNQWRCVYSSSAARRRRCVDSIDGGTSTQSRAAPTRSPAVGLLNQRWCGNGIHGGTDCDGGASTKSTAVHLLDRWRCVDDGAATETTAVHLLNPQRRERRYVCGIHGGASTDGCASTESTAVHLPGRWWCVHDSVATDWTAVPLLDERLSQLPGKA